VRLLRAYPAAWRARYGDELATLVEELGNNARMSWRDRFDVVRSGVTERARVLLAGGLPPREQAREGSLLVLCAWTLFVLGGFGVQKASEHWQAVTPAGKQGLPAAAFDVLFWTAGIGSALVLFGVALSLPGFAALIRGGGWTKIRRPIVRALLLSLLGVAATAGLARWAHSLTPAARNGHNSLYSGVFVAWVLLFAACLAAWVAAARATARQLPWPERILRLEVWLGLAVSAAMAVMTVATAIWWGAVAGAAPWFFEGRPVGSNASALTLNLALPSAFMLGATALGLTGAVRAFKAITHIAA
jgi:hypothetical protein